MAPSKPQRVFSLVQRRILEKSALGEEADFSGFDGVATVSGEFLADVWRGRFAENFGPPRMIHIKGLRIEGDCSPAAKGDPWHDAETFPGLYADECEFDGMLDISGCRINSLVLHSCTVTGSESVGKSGERLFLQMGATTVQADVEIVKCRIAGTVGMNNLTTNGYLLFHSSTLDGAIAGRNARIGGLVEIYKCEIGADANAIDQSVDFSNAKIGGDLNLIGSKLKAAILLYNLDTASVDFLRCRFGACAEYSGVSARADHMQMNGDLTIRQCRFAGIAFFYNSALEGMIDIASTRFCANLDLSAVRAQGRVNIERCDVGYANYVCLELSGLVCQQLQILTSRFHTAVLLFRGKIKQSIYMADCLIGGRFDKNLRAYSYFDGKDLEDRPELGLYMQGTEIGGYMQLLRCQIFGVLRTDRVKLLNAGQIVRVAILSACGEEPGSFEAHLMDCDAVFMLSQSNFSGQVQAIGSRIYELSIEASEINAHKRSDKSSPAIVATDLDIGRKLVLEGNAAGIGNIFHGGVDFSGSKIGSDAIIRATRFLADEKTSAFGNVACDFSKAVISGSLDFAPPADPEIASAPSYSKGAVVLDDATVNDDLRLDSLEISPCGKAEPLRHTDVSHERIDRSRRGVALAMRSTKIQGELVLGKPKIFGLVDLRDAYVGLLADGGGRKWRTAGVQPGWLMLDGFSYNDLDDVLTDQSEAENGSRKEGAAILRLNWLAMQYPDGKASAEFFLPQPYEQLAKLFSAEGDEASRRHVHIARRRLQRKHGHMNRFERTLGWLLDVTSYYGYSPVRAALSLLILIAIGSALAYLVNLQDAFVLSNTDSNPDLPFDPILYALDTAIPLIDLNQESVWAIDPKKFPAPIGDFPVVWLKAIYEIIGLLLVSILVLTLTGTLREKE